MLENLAQHLVFRQIPKYDMFKQVQVTEKTWWSLEKQKAFEIWCVP